MKDTDRRLLEFSYRNTSGIAPEDSDHALLELSAKLSHEPTLSLGSMVDDLAQFAYDNNRFLAGEFLDKFRRYDIAGIMVGNFVDQLPDKGKDVNHSEDPDFLAAREELRDFISHYARDLGRTLHMFLKNAGMVYPFVNFFQLFDAEMKDLLAEQINIAAQNIVANKLKVLFEGNPDEEAKELRRKNFILDFVFSRILRVGQDNHLLVDGEGIIKLVTFLDEHDFELEKLYMLIYSELKEMAKVLRVRNQTRGQIQITIATAIAHWGNYPFLEEDFDFDTFFNLSFMGVIKRVRERKLARKNLRLVDVTHVNPKGMAEAVVPEIAQVPLQDKSASINSSADDFMQQCRLYFNYVHIPQATLSDDEVKDLLAQHFAKAADQIQYTVDEALKNREDSDPILKDCKFIPEILNCRDLKQMLNWLSDLPSFGDQFPQHAHVPYKIVAHQLRKMMELMLFYRKHVFDDRYRNSPRNRRVLEDHMSKILNVRERTEKKVCFRIRQLLCDEPNGKPPEYEVIYYEEAMANQPEDQFVVEIDGKRYKYFPVEEKKFIEVTVDIPDSRNGEPRTGRLLIYSGDGKLIHCKSEQSYLSSLLRGKEPSDVIRWSIVPLSQDINDALRDFLYENYSTGNRVIRDHYEDRHIVNKKAARKSKNSQKFSEKRGYSSAMYATLAKRNDSDQIEHMHIEFETQIFDMDTMLVSNISDYTATSHTKVYTPEREFDNLFRYFFPPVIYGRKFADYKLEGFNPAANGNGQH